MPVLAPAPASWLLIDSVIAISCIAVRVRPIASGDSRVGFYEVEDLVEVIELHTLVEPSPYSVVVGPGGFAYYDAPTGSPSDSLVRVSCGLH